VVASPDGRDGSVTLHTDATLYAGLFGSGQSARLELAPGRHAWVHVARGSARVNGQDLAAGDAVALSSEPAVIVEGRPEAEPGEVLVFDLA
jgi:quercetin 2,3-dioxygenase